MYTLKQNYSELPQLINGIFLVFISHVTDQISHTPDPFSDT